jgi:hypothetical protein
MIPWPKPNPKRCVGSLLPIGLIAIATSIPIIAGKASAQKCPREDAIRAETESSSLKTWRDAYGWYKRYHQCDDGAISEGYSNSVATLLADRWDQLKDLNALAKKDPNFQAFVLHHVDEMMTAAQSKVIKENVRSRCPPSSRHLCRLIESRL